jgi:hypothetical protein
MISAADVQELRFRLILIEFSGDILPFFIYQINDRKTIYIFHNMHAIYLIVRL